MLLPEVDTMNSAFRIALTITLLLASSAKITLSQIPTPASVLGFEPCSERELATYEEIAHYFRELDAASERMNLYEIGKTSEGRETLLSVISSAENIRNLASYKEISQRLALANELTDAQARTLAREGKAVVWIDFGMHSTERAHAQTAPWMAHKVVTEESDEMRFIRDNVILILIPNINPDGTTRVVNWYKKNKDTPYEESAPPELYQKYVGHDNNRDWFMFNQKETRNIARQLYVEWFPQLIYNQHQEAPFPARIFVPPFEDPMNPNIPPLVMRGINAVGEAMTRRFDQESKSGVVSRLQFDTWWNGGMRTTPYYHNMVGILTETGHSSPMTVDYDPEKFPKNFNNGESTTEPSTYYPNPFHGGKWTFRDSCSYMVTGSMAVLDIGAKRREEWLYDIYQMGRLAIEAGANETYVISADQPDPGTAVRMLNALRWGGIQIEKATTSFSAGGKDYPVGSHLVRGSQAFRPHLTDLLNPQTYPDRRLYPGGPPERPYDITGWTLPFQMGVEVDKLEHAVQVTTTTVDWPTVENGSIMGIGSYGFAIDPRANDTFTAVNRLLKAGASVSRTRKALGDWPVGAFVTTTGRSQMETIATELGLSIIALGSPPDDLVEIKSPRIGLYRSWTNNMDEGWTRWVLEQFEFPYSNFRDEDARKGNLESRFDVIVLPDATMTSMLKGLDKDTMPDEYTGGLTTKGAYNIYRFAAAGGTLVAMDTATELPLTLFGLHVEDITQDQDDSEFFIPGTILNLEVDTGHPVAWGMPEKATAFFARSPAFNIGRKPTRYERQRGIEPTPPEGYHIIAHYPEKDLLKSGWLMGDNFISGKAAVVEAPVGKGRVILLGFRVQHRGQTHLTFKLLFNSLLFPSLGT